MHLRHSTIALSPSSGAHTLSLPFKLPLYSHLVLIPSFMNEFGYVLCHASDSYKILTTAVLQLPLYALLLQLGRSSHLTLRFLLQLHRRNVQGPSSTRRQPRLSQSKCTSRPSSNDDGSRGVASSSHRLSVQSKPDIRAVVLQHPSLPKPRYGCPSCVV